MIAGTAMIVLWLFPQPQADTVRVGDPALNMAHLRLGVQTIESFRRMEEGGEQRQSTTSRSISAGRVGDLDVYVIHFEHDSNDTTNTEIVIRADNFALIHHRVKASRDSAAVTVGAGSITGWVVLPEQPVGLVDQEIDHPVFPIEGQIPWLFPMLPLEEGYEAVIPHYSIWDAGEVWKKISVIGSESVRNDGADRDCWIVDRGPLGPPGHRALAWVEKSTSRILKTELRSEDGVASYWSRIR